VYKSTGKLPPPLSTEQLVDCEKQDDGCDGGDIPEVGIGVRTRDSRPRLSVPLWWSTDAGLSPALQAIRYLKKRGMATSADYPDTSSKSGRTHKCKWDGDYAVDVSGFSYALPQCSKGDCGWQNEHKLAAALAMHGPLSICVNSGENEPGGARASRASHALASARRNVTGASLPHQPHPPLSSK
jgi:hypothetical protein